MTTTATKAAAIRTGRKYEFYCTMQEDYAPPAERMRNYTGQRVLVIECVFRPGSPDWIPGESERGYLVQADDGRKFIACRDELDGWIKSTGQYFWPDATYGPKHAKTFLSNEREWS